ncbi:MAG: hypothetical protein B7X02_00330 [Rhodospirillales bacterium 12-54-5]|nr:MAG: hypothetical protein B7X02_00330 [Rhodospirillales bacterium 12-54-5]
MPHDRFFTGCDENFLRSQDFTDLMMPHIMIIGDDDIVDWEELEQGLQFFEDNQLDAMGFHFVSCQLKSNNDYAKLKIFQPLGVLGQSCDKVMALINGEVMDSSIAYMAIISQCGPLYWPTFIGTHIYSRDVFNKISQYMVPDVFCAFFYKQVHFFCHYHVRYAFFDRRIIFQLSNKFLRIHQGEYPWHDYSLARAVQGRQRVEQMCHLWNAPSFEDDALFNAYINAMGTSNLPGADEEQMYGNYCMLHEFFNWSRDCIHKKNWSEGFYFPDLGGVGTLQDIRALYSFWKRVLRCIREYPEIYMHFTKEMADTLAVVIDEIHHYLYELKSDPARLERAIRGLETVQKALLLDENGENSYGKFFEMNLAAFDAYLESKTKEIEALSAPTENQSLTS